MFEFRNDNFLQLSLRSLSGLCYRFSWYVASSIRIPNLKETSKLFVEN